MRDPAPHAARPPVVLVASIDSVLRDSALAGLLCDIPGAVALRYDLRVDDGLLRRVVFDTSAVLEDEWVTLEHACLTCAVREDILPSLGRLQRAGHRAFLLGLPVAAEPQPLVGGLQAFGSLTPSSLVSVLDASALEYDLLGDDLLAERGIALSGGDRRAVGEALAHQLETADCILTPEIPGPRAAALLDHLLHRDVHRHVLHASSVAGLVDGRAASRAPCAGTRCR